jgi:cation/acetate symporter
VSAILPAVEATTAGSPALNIGIFLAFVVFTLGIVIKVAGGKKTAEQYYTSAGAFSGRQNGIAIAGDYLSAASFLGIAGAIALSGYDGFLYSIGFLVAWLVALLLVAELLRNTGRFTMADVLSFRMRQRPVRIAAASVTLACRCSTCSPRWPAPVASSPAARHHGREGRTSSSHRGRGVVMIAYVLIGGMKGTTWVQIIKAVLLIAGAAVITVWCWRSSASTCPGRLDTTPRWRRQPANADKLTTYGLKYGKTPTKIDFISLSMALVLGTAGLPHVLHALLHRPDRQGGPQVGRVGDLAHRWVLPAHPGHRLRRRRPRRPRRDQRRSRQGQLRGSAAGLRARWQLLLGIISGIAFATILAVVAGLTITAAPRSPTTSTRRSSSGQDERPTPRSRSPASRPSSSASSRSSAASRQGQNIAFLVALAFAVAASANLPTILYSLFWKGFTTRAPCGRSTAGSSPRSV